VIVVPASSLEEGTMFTNEHSGSHLEELAARESNGIAVRLLWRPSDDALTVTVVDDGTGASFALDVGDSSPMDVFHHPFAYAAFRRLEVDAPAVELEVA
jgi:hypothetical protein